jgi:RNA polymerase sigma-70 factor (ECF subfamily)
VLQNAVSTTASGAIVTDAALVLAARAGDLAAREALFRRYLGLVVGLSERIIAGRGDADDVAQDAFVDAFNQLHRLENPQAFAAWLGSIVVRRASKCLRRRRLLVRLGLHPAQREEPDASIAPGAPADVVCELRAVYATIMRLPVTERVALVLRRVEGLELAEIAEHMQLSLATVKRRLAAAEARLDRELERAHGVLHERGRTRR